MESPPFYERRRNEMNEKLIGGKVVASGDKEITIKTEDGSLVVVPLLEARSIQIPRKARRLARYWFGR